MIHKYGPWKAWTLAMMGLGACGYLAGCGPKPASPPPAPSQSHATAVVAEPALPEHPRAIKVYTVAQGSGGDENDLVGHTVPLKDSQQPARTALNALIDADHSPLPEGTQVRDIRIEDGLATVDFSKEFKDNFHGSDTQEAQALNSILMTLGQFSTIQRVQILVDGSTADTLGGHLDISGPLDVITPSAVRQARENRDTDHS